MANLDTQSPRAKRRKIENAALPDRSAAITSHAQLRALLVFQQNAAETKLGMKRPFYSFQGMYCDVEILTR